jgi:hypothetical protein
VSILCHIPGRRQAAGAAVAPEPYPPSTASGVEARARAGSRELPPRTTSIRAAKPLLAQLLHRQSMGALTGRAAFPSHGLRSRNRLDPVVCADARETRPKGRRAVVQVDSAGLRRGCRENPRRAGWLACKGGFRERPSPSSHAGGPSQGRRARRLRGAPPRTCCVFSHTALSDSHRRREGRRLGLSAKRPASASARAATSAKRDDVQLLMASCCNPRGCDRFFTPRFARRVARRNAPTRTL